MKQYHNNEERKIKSEKIKIYCNIVIFQNAINFQDEYIPINQSPIITSILKSVCFVLTIDSYSKTEQYTHPSIRKWLAFKAQEVI